MSEYKRLTKKGGFTKNLDLTQELGYSHIYNRLAELENKIEDRELVELPCKVGDNIYTVYLVYSDWYNEDKLTGSIYFKTSECTVTEKNIYRICELFQTKKAFYSKEAAEARIKELQEGKK